MSPFHWSSGIFLIILAPTVGIKRACAKDSYPLPKINKLVDFTAGHELISFMDAFSGYHQIPLAKEDQEKNFLLLRQGCIAIM